MQFAQCGITLPRYQPADRQRGTFGRVFRVQAGRFGKVALRTIHIAMEHVHLTREGHHPGVAVIAFHVGRQSGNGLIEPAEAHIGCHQTTPGHRQRWRQLYGLG